VAFGCSLLFLSKWGERAYLSGGTILQPSPPLVLNRDVLGDSLANPYLTSVLYVSDSNKVPAQEMLCGFRKLISASGTLASKQFRSVSAMILTALSAEGSHLPVTLVSNTILSHGILHFKRFATIYGSTYASVTPIGNIYT